MDSKYESGFRLFKGWAGKKLGQGLKPGRNGKTPDEKIKTRMDLFKPGWICLNPDGLLMGLTKTRIENFIRVFDSYLENFLNLGLF